VMGEVESGVEGKVDETRIVETRRVNFAPTVLQVAP